MMKNPSTVINVSHYLSKARLDKASIRELWIHCLNFCKLLFAFLMSLASLPISQIKFSKI